MILEVSFWVLLGLLVLPFPFKVFEYLTGRDKSPLIVKVEEMSLALFTAIGLFAFYGYLNNLDFLFSKFWFAWLIVSIVWSIASIFFSPKLKYATDILGKKKVQILGVIGVLINAPMYYAVYMYATKI